MPNPLRTARRRTALAISLVAVLMLAFGTIQTVPTAQAPDDDGATVALLEEQQEVRTDIRTRVRAQSIFERSGVAAGGPIEHAPAAGWDGEQKFGNGNDWEPAIGADPNSGYVYALTTRFNNLCPPCAVPSIMMKTSTDGGHTWGPEEYLCQPPTCLDQWQYDPQVEVANDGTVVVSWLTNGWSTWVMRSTDMGQTWSPRVDARGSIGWSDHGFITVSPDGTDVYVAFNRRDSFVAASHDGGLTFDEPIKTSPNADRKTRYYYHYNGSVLPDDSIVIAATSVTLTPYATGKVKYYALRSTDGGATWQQVAIDTVEQQPTCYTKGCGRDHWAGASSVNADPSGDLVYAYAGAVKSQDGQRIFVKTSSNGGQTWTARKQLSPTGSTDKGRKTIAAFPAVEAGGEDDFRVVWMDSRNGAYLWNVWYSVSTDAGATWSNEQDISDASSGAPYKHAKGFDSDYGDYFEITVNNVGDSVVASGQGASYRGPGGTWLNVQT